MKEQISVEMDIDLSNFQKDLRKAEKNVFEFVKNVESKGKIVLGVDNNLTKKVSNLLKKTQKKASDTKIITEPIVSLDEYKEGLRKVEIFARDTKVKLSPELKFEMQADIVGLENKIEAARKQLKVFKDDSEKSTVLKLQINEYKSQLTEAKGQLKNYVNTGDKSLSRLQAKFNSIGKNSFFQRIKTGWLKVLGVIGIVSSSIKKAIGKANEFADVFDSRETAFTGVKKTIDATAKEFKRIEKELNSLSKRIPKTYEELSKIAEVGGQMGIAAEDIVTFTETVAKLSTAISGVSAEEASQQLARIIGITGESIKNIDRLGASLVYLGNNFKANEGEILDFAERLAGAGAVVDLSSSEILGIATAFVDVGVQAEAGGTAVQKALLTINNAVNSGSEKISRFAEVSGMTADEFSKLWKEDSASAFSEFVNGLTESGDEAANILGELIGTDVRLARAFLSVAESGGVLEDAIKGANKEFLDGIALQKEFNERLKTNDAQTQINANRWKSWQSGFGSAISKARLVFSNLMLFTIPYGIALVETGLAKLGRFIHEQFNNMVLVFSFVGNATATLVGIFSDSWRYIADNTGVLVNNILATFERMPDGLISIVNSAVGIIEGLINAPLDGLNSLIQSIKSIPQIGDAFQGIGSIGNISIGKVAGSGIKGRSFQEFKEYSGKGFSGGLSGFSKSIENYGVQNSYIDEIFNERMEGIVNRLNQAGQEKGIQDYKSQLQKETDEKASELEKVIDKIKNKSSKSGGGEKRSSEKSVEEDIKNIKKRAEYELNMIDKLSIAEEEKAKRKQRIFKRVEKEIEKISTDSYNLSEKQFLEQQKNKKDLINKEISDIESSHAKQIKLIENTSATEVEKIRAKKKVFEKTQKQINNIKNKTFSLDKEQLQSIEKLQQQIHENQQERLGEGKNIAQKYYNTLVDNAKKYKGELDEIIDKQKDLKDKLSDLSDDRFEKLAKRKLELLEKEKELKEKLRESRGSDRSSVRGELEKIVKELEYLEGRVDDKLLKKIKDYQSLSESEKIQTDYTEERNELQKQLQELKDQEQEKQKIYDQTISMKQNAEKVFTTFIVHQTDERIGEMKRMENEAIRIAERMAALGFNGRGFKADFVRRNDDGSTTTKTEVINYNTVNQTFNTTKVSERDAYKGTISGMRKANKGMSTLTTK